MAGVILILGLVAAGVYTGSPGFYWAAGILGGFYLLITFIITTIAAVAMKSAKDIQKDIQKKNWKF